MKKQSKHTKNGHPSEIVRSLIEIFFSPALFLRRVFNGGMRHLLTLMALMMLAGCSASQHLGAVRDDTTERVTVGTVQREIIIGMSSAGVIETLGSPNIVSTDENRREVWVYDKISTEYVQSSSSGGIAGLVFGPVGGALASGSVSSGAASTSQRTFTVIVKFDESGKVRDFSYHTSRF